MTQTVTRMKRILLVLGLIAVTGTAHAQRGQSGEGSRLPEAMFPGAQSPASILKPRMSAPLERYANTESLSRDRIESQGYRADGMTQQNDGPWQAGGTRDAAPTRPAGVPTKVMGFPDGRTLEERE